MKNAVISVDWLSLYCKATMLVNNPRYDFYILDAHSAHFEEIYTVVDTWKNQQVAQVQRKPFSRILPRDAIIIKFENKLLYNEDWNHRVTDICMSLGLEIQSISRIDVCADFNEFATGENPKTFINSFLTGKYIKMGRCKFALQGDTNNLGNYSYIRFGSRSNEVCSYLYNKTKELKEVHDKPWIRQRWKDAGLATDRDVWRLEFSMKTTQLRTICKENGLIVRLDLDFISSQTILESIYEAAVFQWFDFRIYDGQQKKCRMKKVNLLGEIKPFYEHRIMPNCVSSNRTDKIVVKKLANCVSQYAVDNQELYEKYQRALEAILNATDLWEYYWVVVKPNVVPYQIR